MALLLSFVGGYVDTAGFLALQGLFTAHVTGNFVTFGAAMVNGATGAWAKLLVLPVFCLAVIATRLSGSALERRRWPTLRILLGGAVEELVIPLVRRCGQAAAGPSRERGTKKPLD